MVRGMLRGRLSEGVEFRTGAKKLWVKEQKINIFGSLGLISVTTTQLIFCSLKAAKDNM